MKSRTFRLPPMVKAPSPALVGLGISLFVAALLGFILAGQIVSPSKRVIEMMMAVAVLVAAFLLPSRYSVGFMLFIIPFPQYTTIGSTTVIFAFIIFSFWLLRVALGYEKKPITSGLELPILVLTLFYVLSFIMVDGAHWHLAIAKFRIYFSCLLIFYLVVNLIRTERDTNFTLNALIASFCVVAAIAMIEIWLPQHSHILDILHVRTKGVYGDFISEAGTRVGSVFGDYEMFAEYLAIFVPIILTRILSEKQFMRQMIWVPMLGTSIMLLLATATRGGFISFVCGMIYLIWIARRIVNYQKLLPILIIAFVSFYVSALLLNQFTDTASLFGRLEQTKFVRGMPDTRAQRWTEAWELIEESPILGHGPYYFVGVDERNVTHRYPHSLFLFLSYQIGIPGALVFYWLLLTAMIRSYKTARRYATKHSELAYMVVLLSSIFVIFFVDEIKISFLRYDNTQHFTWTMLGLLASVSRVANARADKEKREKLERLLEQNR